MADPLSRLLPAFPNLATAGCQITSPINWRYNCIAWAAGDDTKVWWPKVGAFWPAGVPLQDSLSAFIATFRTVGFEPCADGNPEDGFEKVAIYAIGPEVKHAARRLPGGAWTSKLGPDVDITHELDGLAGAVYGQVVQFLKRPSAAAAPPSPTAPPP